MSGSEQLRLGESLEDRQGIHLFQQLESRVVQDHFASKFHAPGIFQVHGGGGARVVQGDDAARVDERYPGVPIRLEPFVAVVGVDEDEVDCVGELRFQLGGDGNAVAALKCDSLAPLSSFFPCHTFLKADAETSDGKIIDGVHGSFRLNRRGDSRSSDSVPHSNFGSKAFALRMPGDAIAFRCRRLRLRGGETEAVQQVMKWRPHAGGSIVP